MMQSSNALPFWKNVQKEIKAQHITQEWVAQNSGISFNTFQGWISKGIYPRVHEAVRIATLLNTSVEYLVEDTVPKNNRPMDVISQNLPIIEGRLELIKEAVNAERDRRSS